MFKREELKIPRLVIPATPLWTPVDELFVILILDLTFDHYLIINIYTAH